MRKPKANKKRLKVVFQSKSQWQRPLCIHPDCRNPATLEAYLTLGNGRYTANIRCCDDLVCKRYAAKMAREGAEEPLAKLALAKGPRMIERHLS